MKLSEFKEYIINKFGELMWEEIEDSPEYEIYNSTDEQKLSLIIKRGDFIKYMNNPTEKLQLEAVKKYPETIEYIENPSEKVKLEAVKQNPFTIIFIKNPTDKVLQEVLKQIEQFKKFEIPIYMLRYLENDETITSRSQSFYIDPIDPLSASRYERKDFL